MGGSHFNNIQEVFEAFKKLKVLIVGDVMIDAYIYGNVHRISPEAPVPVVNVNKREKRLGGAANVALNIQALGAEPILCAVVGDDEDGETFSNLLKKRGITARGIVNSPDRVTTVKNRIIAGSQQMLRVDSEDDMPLNDQEGIKLLEKVKDMVREVDLVIFEDYDKGCLSGYIISEIVSLCNDLKIPTAVDPKKRNFLDYKNCTLFKPNLKELKEGLKVDFDVADEEALDQAVKELHERLNFNKALITLSERGVYLSDIHKKYHLPAHVRNIADVSGAGDTVISIAGLCLALDMSDQFLAALSNLGGGIVCEYIGVVPIQKERLVQEAEENAIFEL